ncbi:putative transcriptional regulator [Xenococcus sp. PCC 7305]|uniref:ArsR/SmtB family transcription factor n=1 Tax=Xenococcus sp. PCC 7305 TaxID=102125 RepID=UPI0002AC17DA|nr:metalloregulator ArsR/SmtB family transcription factor [Xenococcus sp. PCC 7305]ELS03045.1 putative transcriptional regulator [Xenococcus sp. PCC 7305]
MVVSSSPDTILIMAGCHGLSDPLRLAIVELLQKQELCVCELCDRLQVNQSKLSFHLKTLKEAKLIRARQSGRWMYYSLNLPQFVAIEQYLADLRRNARMNSASDCL